MPNAMPMNSNKDKEREFVFTGADFNKIREFVKQETGITLSDAKKNLVYSRLSRRLRQLKMDSFKQYFTLVQQPKSPELIDFINAITTNLTSFFREKHHFDFLTETAIPSILKANAETRKVRVWSAGCSTGEEPYSIAITLRNAIPDIDSWDVKILATDLDTNVLAHAERGVYDYERIDGLDDKIANKWFMRGQGEHAQSVKVSSQLRNMITFRQLNLMGQWPIKGPLDFMFCRNVVIYFDKATQRILFDRYANLLRADGHIFLGHSETMFKVSDRFKLLGNTIYQRVK